MLPLLNYGHPYVTFASAYSSGAYGSSTYNGLTTTTTGTNAGNAGTLTNTGIAVAGIVTIAAVILLLAIVIRIWRRSVRGSDRK